MFVRRKLTPVLFGNTDVKLTEPSIVLLKLLKTKDFESNHYR
jgi:hypothetical protein